MTPPDPEIDVRDLRSVRAAAAREDDTLVVSDKWIDGTADWTEDAPPSRTRGISLIGTSALARKIILFNLVAVILLIVGVLYLNPSRDNLAFQRAKGLLNEAQLIADVFEAQMPEFAPVDLLTGDGIDVAETLSGMNLRGGVNVSIFSTGGDLAATATGVLSEAEQRALEQQSGGTILTDVVSRGWRWRREVFQPTPEPEALAAARIEVSRDAVSRALLSGTQVEARDIGGRISFVATTPILRDGLPVGVVAVVTASGEVDGLVLREREQVLRLFLVGIAISIGLSLALASTIANPLSHLAEAAELSHARNARRLAPQRVRIPDFSGRHDEIGRLSSALHGMVAALYEKIEGNEQFAADVAHEIKNPLASLRSAVNTMRVAKREDQREKLLQIIEHDVKRMDRLVSDISNASRLDTELVKDEEENFDLVKLLRTLIEFLSTEAEAKGTQLITDIPDGPIEMQGLESRLAQVFVNLVSNAISFCGEGDTIRVWAREVRNSRVLVVVEDTGPGIPPNALNKIFQRFYSERPQQQFGNNSGLGLAISKQIVEAHGGVIWAENITDASAGEEELLGARFVVGLPI